MMMKNDIKETESMVVDWFNLAQDRDKCRAVPNVGLKQHILHMGNLLTSCRSVHI